MREEALEIGHATVDLEGMKRGVVPGIFIERLIIRPLGKGSGKGNGAAGAQHLLEAFQRGFGDHGNEHALALGAIGLKGAEIGMQGRDHRRQQLLDDAIGKGRLIAHLHGFKIVIKGDDHLDPVPGGASGISTSVMMPVVP